MKHYLKMVAGISSLVCSSLYAGGMGPVTINNLTMSPFISLEGSWTAFNPDLLTSGVNILSESNGEWGGRLAGGAILFNNNNRFKFIFESGWSYIGEASKRSSAGTIDLELSGADLLLGVLYQPSNYGFFVKGGTLFENANYKVNILKTGTVLINGASVIENSLITGTYNQSYILPEIKVGAVYDFSNWGVSLAYTHAFGTSDPFFSTNLGTSPANNVINTSTNGKLQGPVVNSILLGAYYKFA